MSCTWSPKLSSFWSPRAQHPGRQLRGPLLSGPRNSSSGMRFWPRGFLEALGRILFDEFVPKVGTTAWTPCGIYFRIAVDQCRPDVDSMWTRRGLGFPMQAKHMWTDVGPMWTRCGPHFPIAVDQCGPDVDSMWTRCGLCFPIVVPQMWTRSPFGLYNNIGGWGCESTLPPPEHCTGSPWF